MFLEILIFKRILPFWKGYSVCIVPILAIFEKLSFFEYEAFFGAVFCTEQLWGVSRDVFGIFFGIFIFEPN